MTYLHLTSAPQLPPGYELTQTFTSREGWPVAYITHVDGASGIIVTGDGDNLTIEIDYRTDLGQWRTYDVSRLTGRIWSHEDAVHWWIAAITAGEAREAGMVAA